MANIARTLEVRTLEEKRRNKKKENAQETLTKAQKDVLYRKMLQEALRDTERYARQGTQQTQEVANTVTGNSMTALNAGDLNNYSWSTSRRSILDKADAAEALAATGIFNSPEYALNGQYSGLPELPYMKQLLQQKQLALANSRVQDAAWADGGESAWYDFQTRQSAVINKLADMDAQGRNYYDTDALEEADLLWFDKVVNGNETWKPNYASQQDVDRYNSLVDQWAEIDWDEFDLAKYLGIDTPTKYESQTPGLQSDVDMLTQTIGKRETVYNLEEAAKADPRFGELSSYTGSDLVLGKNEQYMHSNPSFFINNAGVDEQTFNQATWGTRTNWATREVEQYHSPYLDLGYQYLTDDEMAVYNYYYNTDQQKAGEYLSAMQSELLMRRATGEQTFWETLATNKGTGWLAWVMARGSDVLNVEDKLRQTAATIMGTADPNASYYDAANMKRYVDEANLRELGKNETLNKFMFGGKNIGQHGYSAVTTLADAALPAAIDVLYGGGGKINQLLMAGRAYSGGLQEGAERDLSAGQTLLTGGVNAFIGYLTEKMGAEPDVLTSKNNIWKNFIGEGTEEVVDAIGTTAADDVLSELFGTTSAYESQVETLRQQGVNNPEKEAIKLKLEEVVTSFVYGGIAGAAMGVPGNIASYATNRATGKAVSTQGDVNALLEVAGEMEPTTQSYQLAQKLKGRKEKGKKMPLSMLGELTQQLEADLGEEQSRVVNQVMDEAIVERLVELGTDEATAKKNAPAVRKVARGQDPSAIEQAAVRWDDNASQVVKELAAKESTEQKRVNVEGAPVAEPEGQRAGQKWKSEMAIKAITATGEVAGKQLKVRDALETRVEADVQTAVDNAAKKTTPRNAKGKNQLNKAVAYATEGGEVKGEFQRFEMKDGQVQVVVRSGDKETSVKVEDLTDEGGAGTAAIIEYTATAHHNMSADEANTMMTTYQQTGGDVRKFITSFEAVYAAGFADVDAPVTNLPAEVAGAVYEQAKAEGEKAETERVTKAKRLRATAEGSVAWLGQVEDNSAIRGAGDQEALSGALEGMTESQRSTVEVVQALAEELRVNVVLYESKGKNISKTANGKYDSGTHTLYIDVNSGAASEAGVKSGKKTNTLGYAMMRTMGHELTHHMESTSAEGYAQYKAAVKKQLQENGQSWAELVRGKIENAAAEGRKLTRMGAEAEVVADASEYMLQESSFTKKLDSGLYAKVKSFVQSFMEKVREIFTHITGEHRESAALRKVIDGVKQYTGNLQELWDAALGETIQGESAPGDQGGDVTEAVEEAQFSMRDADVSYDALVSKPDMQIVTLTDTVKTNDRAKIVDAGMQNALANGSTGVSGMPAVYVEDIDRSVNVSRKSLKHGLDRRTADQSPVIQHVGELLQNSILVNVVNPRDNRSHGGYVLLGTGNGDDGRPVYVAMVVNEQTNTLESFDVLYAVRTKKGDAASMARALTDEGLSRNVSTISIADLLENVKEKFSDVLSEDVMFHFEVERNKTEITEYLQYSTRDLPHDETVLENNKTTVQSMKPVARLVGNEFVMDKQLVKDVAEYYASIGGYSESPIFGRIDLNKRSVKDSVGHGMGPVKAVMYKAVPDVIEKGEMIDYRENWKGRGYDTAMIAAPVEITEGEHKGQYYLGVIVNLYPENRQRFYVHEAVVVQKKSAPVVQTGTPEGALHGNKDRSFISILEDLNIVNRENQGQYSIRSLPDMPSARQFIAESWEEVASTLEEKNALQIYRNKLDDYKVAVEEVENAEKARDAVIAEKGHDAVESAKAQNVVQIKRMHQKKAYNDLIRAEDTPHVRQVLDFAREFINEASQGTVEDFESRKAEAEQQLAEMEAQYEELRAAGRTQMAAEQKKRLELQQRYARTFKSKVAEGIKTRRAEYEEREQKARAYRQTRDEVNKLRRGIGRKVKRLNALRIRETDQRHVPDELKPVVDLVMAVFTENSISKLAFSEKQVMRLVRAYDALREIDIDEAWRWDDEVSQMLKDLTELVDDYNVLTVSPEGETLRYYFTAEGVESEKNILTGVEAIVSNVLKMVDDANAAFLKNRNETFDAFATQTGEELIHHDDAKILKGKWGDAQMAVDELLRTGNMTPIYFFEHLKNGRIMEVFDQIRKAQTEYARIIRECQDFVQGAKEKHHYGSWTGDAKLEMKTSQGHQITLSREQAMWVYATAKREKSNALYQTEHLMVGGFQYKDTADTGEGKYRATDKPHSLDTADIVKIGEWLTAEQKAYADEVVGFLSTTMADYGNAASMEMFGYKKFLESYYFPFQTAAAQRFQRGDEGASGDNAGTGRVKNSGFTKKLQHKANVALIMDDFTTVAVDHMQKMATYAAMVQPIENMKRLMNHKVIEEDGTINTIRALIGQKYGMPAQKYLQDFLKDLNGAAQGDNRATKGVDFFISAFKRGAVMASASVVLQQPTAMARAMAMVNPKYFMTNPFYRPGKGVWDEMMKHSGTAVIKDMGKFDVGLGLTASEYISDEHLKPWEAYRRLKAESKLKGGAEAYKRFMDWLTAAPGKADQWTWGLIWQAVKKEVAAQNPGMDTGSEAFLDLVGQRFDDVIDHTQVYDSVLTRSNLMRSKNALHKMATSFMSEPTLSINMLYNALAGEHSGKKRAAIIGSVMASQVLAGALAAVVQAWNDDKDERNWLEKYADRAAGNILDNINVFGMVPYISDIISLFQGYEVERADMSVVSTLIKYTTGFWNKLSNGETLTLKDWENFAGNWANLTGVPAKNIMREIRRTLNAVTNTDWSAPNMTNVGYAMKENLGVFYNSKNSAYYERLAKAMLDGDAELVEDLRTYMLTSKMVKEETIDSGIKTALKELYADGQLDEEEAKRFLTDNGLVEDEDAAYWEVDKWEWMRETGGKAGDWRKYDDFTTAVESGENLKQVIQTYLDNGVPAKTLAAKITEEYKPRMKDLYKTNKTEFANLQARILTAYQVLGYDRDKKLKDIQKWLEED